MPFPEAATPAFQELIAVYRDTEIEFPSLKLVSAAQWALESGWGTSRLARGHLNYAGMKWRQSMAAYGTKIPYDAWDGADDYCAFPDHAHFIAAYWKRFDVVSAYDGWRLAAMAGPEVWLAKIGPPWVGGSRSAQQLYQQKIHMIQKRFEDIL